MRNQVPIVDSYRRNDRGGRGARAGFVLLAVLALAGAVQRPVHAAVTGSISTQAGEVRALLATSATTMYAATQGGGLWRSTNGGAAWSRVSALPARYVFGIASPASAPSTLFAGTGDGLFRSTDGGTSWVQLTFDPVRAVAVDAAGTQVLIGVPGAGILRSADGGATFADVSAGLDSSDVRAILLDSAGNAFAGLFGNAGGNWGGVFRLPAGSATWQAWNGAGAGGASALGSKFVTALAINANVLLAATADGTGSGAGKIYRNTLAGPGWNNPGTADAGAIYDIEAVAVDRSDATGRSFLAGTRAFGAWRSTNDGLSWTQVSNGPAGAEVLATTIAIGTLPGSTNAVIAQRGAGLYYTTGIGAATPAWLPATGLAADRVLSLANHDGVAPGTYYVGLKGGGVRRSTDAGATWTRLVAGFAPGGPEPILGSASALAAHPTDTGTVFAALQANGLYRLSGGTTWASDPGAPGVLMPQDLKFDASGSNLYYSLFNAGGGVWRRTTSWSQVASGVWPSGVGAARTFQSASGAFFALMFDQLPLRSASGAPGTFSPVSVAAAVHDVGFMRIAFADVTERPGTAGATMVAATNRGVYRSGDNGSNWYRVTMAGPAAMPTALSAVRYAGASGTLFAGDRSGGLYCSTTDGDAWLAAGNAGAPVVALQWHNGQLFALTDGNGLAKIGATCP